MGNGDDENEKVRYTNPKYKNKYIEYKNKCDALKQKISQIGGNSDLSNWKCQDGATVNNIIVKDGPVAYYNTLKLKYGEPHILVNKIGGICIWKDKDFNEKIILKDEFVKHDKPREHYDFLYSFIKVHIPPEKLVKVIKLSESINYDPLLKLLRARCASIEANIATFKTALDLLDDINVDYAKNIEDRQNVSNYKYVKNLIEKNQSTYVDELIKSSYDLSKI